MRLNAAPRCCAHARTTGQPCRGPAVRGKARCRMHGARAGRPPTHGRFSKKTIETRREVRELLRLVRELIDDAS